MRVTLVGSRLLQGSMGRMRRDEGGWCSKAVRKGYDVGLWKAIKRGWEDFNNRTSFTVGNKWRVKF